MRPKQHKNSTYPAEVVSKQNKNGNGWAQRVRSLVEWCPEESGRDGEDGSRRKLENYMAAA